MTVAQPLDVFVKPEDAARLAGDHQPAVSATKARGRSVPAPAWPSCWTAGESRSSTSGWRNAGARPCPQRAGTPGAITTPTIWDDNPQRQEGLYSVGLCVPTGRTCADDMTELARLASIYGSGAIRLTVGQNAIIADVPEANLPALLGEPLLSRLSPEARLPSRGGW